MPEKIGEHGNRPNASTGSLELLSAAHLLATGRTGLATFEVSVRVLPAHRSYLVACGLDQTLELLEGFRPCREAIDLLRKSSLAPGIPSFVYDWLAQAEFTGDLDAVPEGTIAFAEEPILRVRAPAHQAVLVGALILSTVGYQTSVATKMSRIVHAAKGRKVFELCAARSAGSEAALLAARAACIGGAAATTNMTAAARLSIQPLGVISMSLLLRDTSDEEAALSLRGLSDQVTVLLDHHQPVDSIHKLLQLGAVPASVLIDCGEFLEVTQKIRSILNSAGHRGVSIHLAGGLEEEYIDNLVTNGVLADGFCVGGQLANVADDSCLKLEFNIVEWEIGGKMVPIGRSSTGRTVRPGAKAVYRKRERGLFRGDTVQPLEMPTPSGEIPLLVPVMKKGRKLSGSPSLNECRTLCHSQLQMLPADIAQISGFHAYPVTFREVEPRTGAADRSSSPAAIGRHSSIPPRSEILEGIDDSADFGAVSSAFEERLAARLGLKPTDAALRIKLPEVDPKPSVLAGESLSPAKGLFARSEDLIDEQLDFLPEHTAIGISTPLPEDVEQTWSSAPERPADPPFPKSPLAEPIDTSASPPGMLSTPGEGTALGAQDALSTTRLKIADALSKLGEHHEGTTPASPEAESTSADRGVPSFSRPQPDPFEPGFPETWRTMMPQSAAPAPVPTLDEKSAASPDSTQGSSGLLDAAQRLRRLKSTAAALAGDGITEVSGSPSAPMTGEPVAASTDSTSGESRSSGTDLIKAAARLKSIARGEAPPPSGVPMPPSGELESAADPSKKENAEPSKPLDYSGESKSTGTGLLSAAARLKALKK